ncbi:MAG: 50S ribosomal protein L11 methyltransferase [Clostridia bacterium]|nr:50S ribosomal protein L11 methyltransferase [Clostridia bacterium]
MENAAEPVWTQIKIDCSVADLDTVCAIAGMVDNGLMIEDYSDVREGVNAIYGELLGEEILEKDPERAAVSVFIPESRSVPEAVAFLRDRLRVAEISAQVETVGVKESDWADSWKKYYKPVHIGERIVIVPAWEEYTPQEGEIFVSMDPGMAFGTGTHETTRLCATFIEKYLKPGKRVLDVGTGSGILAIIAAKLGASQVDALDIDANAVIAAQRNCNDNGVPFIRCGVSDLIAAADGEYDFVCANIVADIIIRMAPDVGAHMKHGALLVVSGIIQRQAEDAKAALRKGGLELLDSLEENDWNSFVFIKP